MNISHNITIFSLLFFSILQSMDQIDSMDIEPKIVEILNNSYLPHVEVYDAKLSNGNFIFASKNLSNNSISCYLCKFTNGPSELIPEDPKYFATLKNSHFKKSVEIPEDHILNQIAKITYAQDFDRQELVEKDVYTAKLTNSDSITTEKFFFFNRSQIYCRYTSPAHNKTFTVSVTYWDFIKNLYEQQEIKEKLKNLQ